MAGNAKSRSERYADELKKLYEKRDKLDEKIRDVEERKEEAEKTEIYDYVKELNLSPRKVQIMIEHAAHNMPGDPDLIVDLTQDKTEDTTEDTTEDNKEEPDGE